MPQYKIPYLNLQHVNSPLLAAYQTAVAQVFQNSNYINGVYCADFEKAYAAYTGTAYCSGVSNGLDALILSLKALGIEVGDEVIVPAHTYIATWLAVTHVGATIVPVDCDLSTYNIDANLIEEKITPRTKCIIPVHLYGQPCNMEAIMAIANKHNLYVVEDNAQAHGATFNKQKTGSFGHINATSFYPGKNLGALGDAGAITTNSAELYDKVTHLKNYGSAIKYQHTMLGGNNRLDELQAAFLNLKLPLLDGYNAERNRLAAAYNSGLAGVGDIVLPQTATGATHVYHIYIIRTNHRNELQQYLAAKGVETLIHYPTAVYNQPAYAYLGIDKGAYPNAAIVADTCLSLPVYPGLSDGDMEYIINIIKGFFT
jgi:dTDP-4-amino-4,6-dideoxygalactose transaminase